jgi:membrane protein
MNGDVGAVLSAIGGRFAWRYWWPVIPWLADIAMVATFRRENVQEPAGVLFLVCLATVPLLWLWGARFAVALGHARRRVFPMLIALSVGLPMLWQVVGSISRLIVGLGDGGHSEGLFLFYGLPIVALLMLGCALWLGYGWRGVGVAILGWGAAVALFYLVLWPLFVGFELVASIVGTCWVILMLVGSAWGGWGGFRIARA